MIEAVAPEPFEACVESFPTGRTGTVAYQILDSTDGVVVARTTVGVAEDGSEPGDYTVTITLNDTGDYRIVWDFGTSLTAEEDIDVAAGFPEPIDFAPTLDDVGALLRTRTIDTNGNELGTFTDATRPTDDQVNLLIASAAERIAAKFGGTPAASLVGPARELAALRAVMMVELSYFPDQVASQRSPYTQLQQLYTDGLADLLADRSNLGADGEPGTADDDAPLYAFPIPGDPLLVHAPDAQQANDFRLGATLVSAGMRFTLEVAGDKLIDRSILRGIGAVTDATDAFVAIGELLIDETKQQFESEGRHASGGWKTLKPATVTYKRLHGLRPQILQATGAPKGYQAAPSHGSPLPMSR